MKNSILSAALLLASISSIAGATTTTINFEQYAQGTLITNQYSSEGISFLNATELTVSGGYNSSGYPPHSGAGVIYDSSALLTILLTNPSSSVSGFYSTSTSGVIDEYDSIGTLLGTVALSNDLGSSNAFTTNVASISKLVFVDADGSNNLTLDDINFSPAAVAATPEPSSFILLGTGIIGLGGAARRRFVKA